MALAAALAERCVSKLSPATAALAAALVAAAAACRKLIAHVGLVADISKISRADAALAAALTERCVSRISRAKAVALTSAEFLWLPQRWQLRWQNAASAEFLGLSRIFSG